MTARERPFFPTGVPLDSVPLAVLSPQTIAKPLVGEPGRARVELRNGHINSLKGRTEGPRA